MTSDGSTEDSVYEAIKAVHVRLTHIRTVAQKRIVLFTYVLNSTRGNEREKSVVSEQS